MQTYEQLAQRGLDMAALSTQEVDRVFWTTYALNIALLASCAVEDGPESVGWQRRKAAAIRQTVSYSGVAS